MKMKKISKMKNNCTSMWNSGHFDRKAQAALALAVSLWIANGGVASAEKVSVSENTTVSTDESGKEYLLGGNINAPKGEGITFTVENNGKVTSINGNSVYAKSSGNTVIVK
ncbi:MAG: hypothetical protein K6E80_07180, partial [Schwartzia sp.]|nr:hypothetical protein [Schwartzia sp. (in: firmicutes)]